MISGNNQIEIETNKKVDYEESENLKEFDENEDFDTLCNEVVSGLSDESDWTKQFEAMNNLRRLNKFLPDLFYKVLEHVINSVGKLAASLRSNLSKLTLILVKEILYGGNFHNAKILKVLLSSTLIQSASMKSFIKEESNLCLDNISTNSKFFDLATLEILIEEISNKNLQISEKAFNTVSKLIENWDEEKMKIPDNKWKMVVQQLINLYSLKREPFVKRSCRVAESIFNKLGDEFHQVLHDSKVDSNNQNMLSVMARTSANAKKSTKPTGSIKEFIRSNK